MLRVCPPCLALSLALLMPHAAGQGQMHFLSLNSGRLSEIDIDAGAILDANTVDLPALTPFGFPQTMSVGWVRGEVWVGTVDGVLRFGGSPLGYIDRLAPGQRISRIVPSPSGAFLSTQTGPLLEVSMGGTTLQTFAFPDPVDDIEPFRAGYLVVTGGHMLYMDTALQLIAEFGPTLADDTRAASSIPFEPQRAAVLADGRVAVASGHSAYVVIANADGSFQSFAQTGAFEFDVFSTGGGLVLVPDFAGLALLDPDTLDLFPRFLFPPFHRLWLLSKAFSRASSSSGRGCSASVNSTGREARVHLSGATNISVGTLSAIATSLPPSTAALTIFGVTPFDAPFGDGRLCVSPFAPGLTRGPVTISSATGAVEVEFDFATLGLGAAFGPGTTWYFQMLYRDTAGPGGSGFNGTDGVFVSFRP